MVVGCLEKKFEGVNPSETDTSPKFVEEGLATTVFKLSALIIKSDNPLCVIIEPYLVTSSNIIPTDNKIVPHDLLKLEKSGESYQILPTDKKRDKEYSFFIYVKTEDNT